METRQVATGAEFTCVLVEKHLLTGLKSTCLDNHSSTVRSWILLPLIMKSRVAADILYLLLTRFTCYEQDNHINLMDSLALFPLA